jgi:hypothetical protein
MRLLNGSGPFRIKFITGISLLFSLSLPAYAHHSAACCDFTQSVPITGIVKSITVANPHIKLVLIVTDAKGNSKEIFYEGHSRNNVYRRGWRPNWVKEGDKVTINIAPMKSGEDGGYIHSFTLSDGRQF